MAKLYGKLMLTRIPKELVQTDKNGEKFVWVDVAELKRQSLYGDTHYIAMYNVNKGENIFLANLRERQPKGGAAPEVAGDLPEDNGLGF